jgi:hypothetical protein
VSRQEPWAPRARCCPPRHQAEGSHCLQLVVLLLVLVLVRLLVLLLV